MIYANDVEKVCAEAQSIATAMLNTQVFIPHIVAAALKFGYVADAVENI